MAKKTAALLPTTDELLRQFGERLRLARLRRQLSAKQLAERTGMAPMTLRGLERGGAGVTMGAYLAVMQVLGIEGDLSLLGRADPVGRELQDARLPGLTRTTRSGVLPFAKPTAVAKRMGPVAGVAAELRRAIASSPQKHLRRPSEGAGDWILKSGFASADALADLLDPLASPKKKAR